MHADGDTLTDFALRKDAAAIPYMLTGSVAGQFHGLDRSTMGTDVVIDLDAGRAGALLESLRDGWYVDAGMVVEGLERRSMFNVLPVAGGKFDLIPLRREPYELAKFERRQAMDWHGTRIWVITPEDLVLSKLLWAKDSHSDVQFRDVRVIMAKGSFDERSAYFQQWLGRLGLRETLDHAAKAGHDA